MPRRGILEEAVQRANPPFRADPVGSLLRPTAPKDAREKREEGEITPAQLKTVEDQEIIEAIRKQVSVAAVRVCAHRGRQRALVQGAMGQTRTRRGDREEYLAMIV
jgi:hypothetical protein